MSDHPGQTTQPDRAPVEPGHYPGPESSGLPLHPRLRHPQRVDREWQIRVDSGGARINPRTLHVTMSRSGDSALRRFTAVQEYGSDFIEITEFDQFYEPLFYDAQNEPEIARFIHKAFDVQWPMGARGVARRGVQ